MLSCYNKYGEFVLSLALYKLNFIKTSGHVIELYCNIGDVSQIDRKYLGVNVYW